MVRQYFQHGAANRLTILLLMLCAIAACDTARAGDWKIGLKQLSISDPVSGSTMTGMVTYPTAVPGTPLTVGRFKLSAAKDAPPAAGMFPLVVFSHGTGALPELYLWLFEGLTEKGFIVAGVAHPNDNYNDRSGSFGDALLVYRSQHISALIDATEHDPVLGQTIDAGKIGILGHSAGGYAALLSTGGVPDFSQFRGGRCQRRAQARPDQPRFTHDPSAAPAPDRRVRAAVAMAPALGCLFDRDGIGAVRVPLRFYQADDDEILQPGFNADHFASLFAQPPDVVHLANAGHFVFLNTCPFVMSLMARQICFDARGTDRDEVHRRLIEDIAQFFSTSFDAKLRKAGSVAGETGP